LAVDFGTTRANFSNDVERLSGRFDPRATKSNQIRDKEGIMLKSMSVICLCLMTLPALCETAPKYEVATVIDVKPHQADNKSSDVARYDVSIKVGGTVYVTIYTDTLGTGTVKYVAGRQLLVHVGKNTITYNDILGQSHDLPIVSQTTVTSTKQSKP
jgi:hypothetical protein